MDASNGAPASDGTSVALRKALATCQETVEQLVVSMADGITTTLQIDPSGRKRASLEPLFDSLLRRTSEAVDTLSSINLDAHKSGLKAQAATYKMKLESSRTAASVTMKNQAAELQATFTVQMQKTMSDLTSGGAAELLTARKRVEELEELLHEATCASSKNEEMVKTLRGLLRGKETEVDQKSKEVEDLTLSLEDSKFSMERMVRPLKDEISSLQQKLLEGAAEAERAAVQVPVEAKRLVGLLAERMRSEAPNPGGSREGVEAQMQRLLAEMKVMSEKLANADADFTHRNAANIEELEAARKELASMKGQLGTAQHKLAVAQQQITKLSSLSSPAPKQPLPLQPPVQQQEERPPQTPPPREATPEEQASRPRTANVVDVPEQQQQLIEAHEEISRLSTALGVARCEAAAQTEEAVQRKEEAESVRRDMLETLSRAVSETQRATMLNPDECKRQVKSMAGRLAAELEAARLGERETAHEQLHRLLDELALLGKQHTAIELKLAEEYEKGAEARAAQMRLKQLQTDDTRARELVAKGLGEVQVKFNPLDPLSHQLLQLIMFYRRAIQEANNVRGMLDRALREVALGVTENMTLGEKAKYLLEELKSKMEEVEELKLTIENVRAEISIYNGENSTLRDRCNQLLQQYHNAYDKEQVLRTTVKQQHASLYAAYHRVKDVEVELQRSNGAAAEEREALVNTALNALHQLRVHLGSIHALKPEVTKPVDEVCTRLFLPKQ